MFISNVSSFRLVLTSLESQDKKKPPSALLLSQLHLLTPPFPLLRLCFEPSLQFQISLLSQNRWEGPLKPAPVLLNHSPAEIR